MAVSIIKSALLSNRDANPQVLNDPRSQGFNFNARALVTSVASDSANSQYGMFSLPSNCVVTSLELSTAALGTSASADIGLWQTPAKGGYSASTGWATMAASGSDIFFADAIAVASAQTKTQVLFNNANFYTLLNADQKLWQVLGLASDPNLMYDLVVQIEVAVTAGGAILLECTYKAQQ